MSKKNKRTINTDKQSTFPQVSPRTESQRQLLANFEHDTIIVASGSPGSGKTMLSAWYSAKELQTGRTNKIVITRPIVGLGKSIAALPGDINEKLAPWVEPIVGNLKEFLGKGVYDCHLNNNNIELVALEHIRGRSYDDGTIILLDEAQNADMDTLKAVSTRIGQGSQLIISGDPKQSDINKSKSNPLDQFCEMCVRHKVRGFSKVNFTHHDIQRDDIVKDLIIMFDKEGI